MQQPQRTLHSATAAPTQPARQVAHPPQPGLGDPLLLQLDVGEHRFVRTTSAAHKALVSDILQRAHDRGDIYKSAYSGHYCVGCESYKDDEEMGPGNTCLMHRTECKLREEENYFFRLSKCAAAVPAVPPQPGGLAGVVSRPWHHGLKAACSADQAPATPSK